MFCAWTVVSTVTGKAGRQAPLDGLDHLGVKTLAAADRVMYCFNPIQAHAQC